MFGWWRRRREDRVLEHRRIPDTLWLDTVRLYPFLTWRPVEQLERLRERCTVFLARKEFTTTHGLELTDAMAVAIAAQACLPVIELGLDWYDGFVGIVLSPDEVVAPRAWTDEDGVVHTGDEVLSGEAMPGGPVLLSWRDASEAGWTAEEGYNVVVHEFVHVIDMADGLDADGRPPLPSLTQRRAWDAVMGAALTRHQQRIEAGAEPWLDPYAAHGPEEFFAVTAEAFFVSPQGLRAEERTVYELLQDFFRQDPARYQR